MSAQQPKPAHAFVNYIEDVLARASRLAEVEQAAMTQQVIQQGLEAIAHMNATGGAES